MHTRIYFQHIQHIQLVLGWMCTVSIADWMWCVEVILQLHITHQGWAKKSDSLRRTLWVHRPVELLWNMAMLCSNSLGIPLRGYAPILWTQSGTQLCCCRPLGSAPRVSSPSPAVRSLLEEQFGGSCVRQRKLERCCGENWYGTGPRQLPVQQIMHSLSGCFYWMI